MDELIKKTLTGMTKEELNELLLAYDEGGFIMWSIIIRVLCGDKFVGTSRADIAIDEETVELYVCGIKFMISADSNSVTVSTSSTTTELNRHNSWYSGLMSEPGRNRDKAFDEVSYEVEATKHRCGM